MDAMRYRDEMRARRVRQPHRRRSSGFVIAVTVAVVCPLAAAACGESARGASQTNTPQGTQVVSHEEVVLLPRLGAGEGGWCLTTISAVGCPTLHLPVFQGPIVIENWSGQGSSSQTPVREAVILTTSQVAAVSLEGRAPIATRAESVLPNHLRVAVVELRGGSGGRVLGITAPPALPRSHFTALDSKGEAIPQRRTPGPPLEFEVPSRSWGQSASAPPGVCGIEAKGLAGLVSEGGSVMTTVRPHPDIRGREFVDCLRASYLLDNWPLEADVLLDAGHPGSTPPPLTAMRPLAGHPEIFQGPGVEGETIARRIPGAWLLVAKGKDLGQRLIFLEHLRVRIRL